MTATPFSLSVKILIQDQASRWLMLRRGSDRSWNPGKWDFPGGKIRKGENIEEALRREVFEETGLAITVEAFFGAIQDETTPVRSVHLVMTGSVATGEIRLSDENDEYAWVEASDILALDLCGYIRELVQANWTLS